MTIRPARGTRDPHAAIARELAGRHPRLARLVQFAHPIRDRCYWTVLDSGRIAELR